MTVYKIVVKFYYLFPFSKVKITLSLRYFYSKGVNNYDNEAIYSCILKRKSCCPFSKQTFKSSFSWETSWVWFNGRSEIYFILFPFTY